MKVLEVMASVKGGSLVGFNRAYFKQMLSLFEGKKVFLKVERASKKRSNHQNRYYWGVVVPMIQEAFLNIGHDDLDAEDVHAFLKARFNTKQIVNEKTGEVMEVPLSTTDLTTSDFMDFISMVQKFAAENLDIYIPDANEQGAFNF